MERNEAAESRKYVDRRGTFERFTGLVNQKVSRAPFFLFCMVLVILWLVSVPMWHDLISWQSAIQTISAVLSLLLLLLLETSGRREEEAAQEKLNVLAEGLAALMESQPHQTPRLETATRRLSEAVNLESRHWSPGADRRAGGDFQSPGDWKSPPSACWLAGGGGGI